MIAAPRARSGRVRARRVVLLAPLVALLASCTTPSNAPITYDDETRANFMRGCEAAGGEGSTEQCGCVYDAISRPLLDADGEPVRDDDGNPRHVIDFADFSALDSRFSSLPAEASGDDEGATATTTATTTTLVPADLEEAYERLVDADATCSDPSTTTTSTTGSTSTTGPVDGTTTVAPTTDLNGTTTVPSTTVVPTTDAAAATTTSAA